MPILPNELDPLSEQHALYQQRQEIEQALDCRNAMQMSAIAQRLQHRADQEKLYYLKPSIARDRVLLGNMGSLLFFMDEIKISIKYFLDFMLSLRKDELNIFEIIRNIMLWSLRRPGLISAENTNNIFYALLQTPDFCTKFINSSSCDGVITQIKSSAEQAHAFVRGGMLANNAIVILRFLQICDEVISASKPMQEDIKQAVQNLIETDSSSDPNLQRVAPIAAYLQTHLAQRWEPFKRFTFAYELSELIKKWQEERSKVTLEADHKRVRLAHN